MRIAALAVMVAASVLASGAWWSSGVCLTMSEAVEGALSGNPSLEAGRLTWEAAAQQKTRVTSLPDPVLEIGFGASGPSYEGSMSMVGITQTIPFPGKILTARSGALSRERAAEAAYRSLERDITRNVRQAYIDLLLLDRIAAIYREYLLDARLLTELVRRRYEVGLSGQHDLARAQIETDLAENRLATLEYGDRAAASARLRALLDLDASEPLGALEMVEIELAAVQPESIRAAGISASPVLSVYTHRLDAAREDLELAGLEWIPNLKIKLFAEEMDMVMGTHRSRGVMVALNLPVWAWRNRALTASRRALLDRATSEVETGRNQLELELEAALASLTSAQRSYDLYEESVLPQAGLVYASALSSYETGEVDIDTVITARSALREARLARERLWARLAHDLAQLERLTGRKFNWAD